jgi:predicted RNA-binding Zn-ribbon protein involved in translation (DUF1610 family)
MGPPRSSKKRNKKPHTVTFDAQVEEGTRRMAAMNLRDDERGPQDKAWREALQLRLGDDEHDHRDQVYRKSIEDLRERSYAEKYGPIEPTVAPANSPRTSDGGSRNSPEVSPPPSSGAKFVMFSAPVLRDRQPSTDFHPGIEEMPSERRHAEKPKAVEKMLPDGKVLPLLPIERVPTLESILKSLEVTIDDQAEYLEREKASIPSDRLAEVWIESNPDERQWTNVRKAEEDTKNSDQRSRASTVSTWSKVSEPNSDDFDHLDTSSEDSDYDPETHVRYNCQDCGIARIVYRSRRSERRDGKIAGCENCDRIKSGAKKS